jgi:pimeloyl-ACP methyl ester carboxylesterase
MSTMGIKEFQVTIDGNTVSGRVAEPDDMSASDSPVIVAIHGGTYFSKYFDIENHSLLQLAAARNVPVIAIDRPAYGTSTPLPDAPDLLHQNALYLNEIIPSVVAELLPGPTSVFLIGHSMGGAIAITIASLRPEWLTGIAASGIGTIPPPELAGTFAQLPLEPLVTLPTEMKDAVMFGPAGSMADEMPAASHAADTTVPLSELFDVVSGWIQRFPDLADAVVVPVHYRQAEFDKLWVTDKAIVDAFGQAFRQSARVDAQITAGAGHCIDFHNASKQFQNEQLDFALSSESR